MLDPDLDPPICGWLRACFVWQGGGGEPAGPAAAALGAPQLGGDCVPPKPAQQQVVPPQGEVGAQEGGAHQSSQCTGIQSSFLPPQSKPGFNCIYLDLDLCSMMVPPSGSVTF